jgi:peptidoglycan hydrolase-like protein with peptidoglycan-binding domain
MPSPRIGHTLPRALRTGCLVLLVAVSVPACNHQTTEERARETAEKMQKSLVDVEAIALDQTVDRAVVSEVQRNLTAINEYQGEIDGKLDSVTVNAIQAFQRTAGVKDDGIITDATRQKLAAAATQAKS